MDGEIKEDKTCLHCGGTGGRWDEDGVDQWYWCIYCDAEQKDREERARLQPIIDEKSKKLEEYFKWIQTQKCEVCGEPATGSGDGVLYCHQCLWKAFFDMEDGLTGGDERGTIDDTET